MRFAYADPPYLGLAKSFYGRMHAGAAVYDTIDGHYNLIQRLETEFPDGWAMSLHSPALKHILPLCPPEARVMAWIKPFCSFKPGIGVAYAWEPVIVCGGRKRSREQATVRDWISANITLERGFPGAKPTAFCFWLFEVLNLQDGDTIEDLFPGSGAVSRAIIGWMDGKTGTVQDGLFADAANGPFAPVTGTR